MGFLLSALPYIVGGLAGTIIAVKDSMEEDEKNKVSNVKSSIVNKEEEVEDDEIFDEFDDKERAFFPSKHTEITEDLYEKLMEFNAEINGDDEIDYKSFNEEVFTLTTTISHDVVMCNTAYKLEDINYIEEFGTKVGNKMNDFDALKAPDKKTAKLKEKIRHLVMDFLNLTQDYLDANWDDEDDEEEESDSDVELKDDPDNNFYPVMIARSTDYIEKNCEGIFIEYCRLEKTGKDFNDYKESLKNISDFARLLRESYIEKDIDSVADCKDLIEDVTDGINSLPATNKNIRQAKENMAVILVNINKLCNTLINECIEPEHDENDKPIKIKYNRNK